MNYAGFLSERPEAKQLVSLREARELLSRTHPLTLDMAARLADAGVLGEEFSGRFGRAFPLERVQELAALPERELGELATLEGWEGINQALVLRQGPAEALPANIATVRPFDTREFQGVHVALIDHADPAVRQASADAMRMYWPVAPRRRALIDEALGRGETIPVITSVAKYVAAVWSLGGIEDEPEPWFERGRQQRRVALKVEPAGSWADALVGGWLSSGHGPSTIWWDR